MRKKILSWIIYSLYLIGIVLIADYIFYLSYKKKIIPLKLADEKSLSELESKVGWTRNDKMSSFGNFEEKKKKGIIRIGCFGDSMTHGDEVNNIYDYPTLLQNIFSERGYKNVEVINFGAGGYGFHQAFILWEYLGKKYNLDYVLLGPLCFQPDGDYQRDSTFGAPYFDNYIEREIYVFHSRYILKNNDVRLIELAGKTKPEIIKNYFRFIPPLRYTLFDSEAPSFLIAPIACLLPNKKLKRNPFYYKNNIEKEMLEIYKILLSKIADNTPQVILGHYLQKVVNLGREVGRKNIFAALLNAPPFFPYRAFANHSSPCGNRLLAQQFFDCLTNKSESTLTILKIENIDKKLIESVEVKKRKLSEYREIAIEIDNIKAGRFYNIDFSDADVCNPPSCEPVRDSLSKIVSLLAIKNDDAAIFDSVFLPLDFELEDNMPLTIGVISDEGITEYSAGEVNLLNPGLNIGILDLGNITFDRDKKIIETEENSKLYTPIPGRWVNKAKNITILLKDIPILTTIVESKSKSLKFASVNDRFVIIRADGRELLDIEKLQPTGKIYLSLYPDQEEPVKISIAQWSKMPIKVPLHGRRVNLLSGSVADE